MGQHTFQGSPQDAIQGIRNLTQFGSPFMTGIPGYPTHAIPPMPAHMMPPHFQPGGPGGLLAPGGPQQRPGPSALDRARDNVTEMRRLLTELREQNADATELQTRIQNLQDRTRSLEDYIDPLRLSSMDGSARAEGGTNSSHPPQPRLQLPSGQFPNITPSFSGPNGMNPPLRPNSTEHDPRATTTARPQQGAATQPRDVSCYLLSNPQGPHALLLSPQYGTYVGMLAEGASRQNSGLRYRLPDRNSSSQPAAQGGLQPTPTLAQAIDGDVPPIPQPNALALGQPDAGARPPGQQQQRQAQDPAQDPLGPIQPLLGHFWLLLRILIFAYFLLGANMGWRRPIAMLLTGAGFMMIRAGLFGDGGVLRRWWEGVVRVERAQPANAQAGREGAAPVQGEAGGAQNNPTPPQAGNGGGARQQAQGGRMPTPEELANRLLRDHQDGAAQRRAWWREQIRPVERVVALLIASLWPGVGEAHVRALRAEEQRRREEEEVERRRLEEEEKAKREQEEEAAKQAGSSESGKGAAGSEQRSNAEAGPAGSEKQESRVENQTAT